VFTRYRFQKLSLCLLLLAALASSAFASAITKQLAEGVTLYQEINTTPGAEQIVNLVSVDPKVEGVEVKAAVGRDVILNDEPAKGCETIGALTERRGAVVGINADFFPMGTDSAGDPLGVCIIDGELVSEPSYRHAVAAILNDGTCVFDNPIWKASLTLKSGVSRQIDGINRNRETNQVIAYTSIFYSTTRSKYKGTEIICTSEDLPVRCGSDIKLTVVEVREDSVSSPIPENGMVLSAGGPAAHFLKSNLKPGDTFTVRFDISSTNGVDWTQVKQAVGGRPWILKDGKEYISMEYEKIGASFSTTRHPRSAIGRSADGKTMLVTVDGRQGISKGVSLPELSAIMKRLGAVDAINLDGGGSTTLSYRGSVINSPSGGIQRTVANGVLVFAKQPQNEEVSGLSILVPAQQLAVSKGTQLYLTQGDEKYPLAQNQIDRIVWATSNGMGFINQYGYLIPSRVRKGPIRAFYGDQQVEIEVNVAE
jgi:exopolysaccharide biosynthesis protein